MQKAYADGVKYDPINIIHCIVWRMGRGCSGVIGIILIEVFAYVIRIILCSKK